MVVGAEVCFGVECGFHSFVMGRSVGVGVAWYVGVFVAVPSPALADSPGQSGLGDALYGVELRL